MDILEWQKEVYYPINRGEITIYPGRIGACVPADEFDLAIAQIQAQIASRGEDQRVTFPPKPLVSTLPMDHLLGIKKVPAGGGPQVSSAAADGRFRSTGMKRKRKPSHDSSEYRTDPEDEEDRGIKVRHRKKKPDPGLEAFKPSNRSPSPPQSPKQTRSYKTVTNK